MAHVMLTESHIERVSGKQLVDIVDLDLSNSKLKTVLAESFHKLPQLIRLDLSNNSLRRLPSNMHLTKLEVLDVSDNQLESVLFLSDFKNLKELRFACNGFGAADCLMAVVMCPNLKLLNDESTQKYHSVVDMWKEKFKSCIDSIWHDNFELQYLENGFPSGFDLEKVSGELLKKVRKTKIATSAAQPGFKDFLLKRLCEDTVRVSYESSLHSEQKKKRRAVFDYDDEEVNSSPATKRPCHESPRKSIKSSTDIHRELQTKLSTNFRRESTRKSSAKKENGELNVSLTANESTVLSSDYDPIHCLQCHFGGKEAQSAGHTDNDPADNKTNVWCCAMEPDPNKTGETTSLVATCGGDTVCLIDCSTGHLMQRYKQNKEQFFTVAWTTLLIENEDGMRRKENVLAVGGQNCHLKLLLPSQGVCYAESNNKRPNRTVIDYYYSSLCFHPQNKTWLFGGSSDTTITLLDIGTPSGPQLETEIRPLRVFLTTDSRMVNNLIFHESTNHIIASTEQDCLAWKCSEDDIKLDKKTQRHSDPIMELCFPRDNKQCVGQVDGLVLIDDIFAACKLVSNGCIFVFNLKKVLSVKKSKTSKSTVVVEPVLRLKWADTDTDYIGLAFNNGTLTCGDAEGSIWMYNLDAILQTSAVADDKKLVAPSKVLRWPFCLIGARREEEKRIADVFAKPESVVINVTTFTSAGSYLVATTDCNLVVIWKRVADN